MTLTPSGAGLSGHAVILAAGAGSRLRDCAPVKPLAEVGGRLLVGHALAMLGAVGVQSATVVVGYQAEAVSAALADSPIEAEAIFNPQWDSAPNGVSVLVAAERIRPGTLLMMADHLVDPLLVRRLIAGASLPLALAVDRRLGHPWVDEADVTRVRTTADGRIAAIGKGLNIYDAYDCGVFLVGPALVAALGALDAPSLSLGVARLAADGLAQAVDIGDAAWLDVDDARALAIARDQWAAA